MLYLSNNHSKPIWSCINKHKRIQSVNIMAFKNGKAYVVEGYRKTQNFGSRVDATNNYNLFQVMKGKCI